MCIGEILKIADILGKIGQFLFGLFALFISVYALISKRKDVFKSELSKAQFQEMGRIRNLLNQIFYDVFYVKDFKSYLETSECSLAEMKQEMPEQWEQFQNYKKNSNELFYKLSLPENYLIPKWIEPENLTMHCNQMKQFAPFTVLATGNKKDLVLDYQNSMLELIKYIDVQLKKNA